jgi:pseudouridylate synthase
MQSSPKKPQGKHSSTKGKHSSTQGKRFDSKENTTNQKRKTSSGKENFSSDRKKSTTGREKTPYKKEKPSYNKEKSAEYSPTTRAPYKRNTPKPNATDQSKGIRLNKYIANAGICARREADRYIAAGNVEVNGKPMTELGYRVQPTDVVKFDGKNISAEKKEYILLNKPKGFITTTQDEKGRKTVMDLVAGAAEGNIKPVGRLDRLTTGLLLLTNDGDLMKKLTHPSHGVRKIYHVILDKKLALADFHKIQEGLTLEDGFIQVDDINFVDGAPHNEIGVKIHSGRNRIVRRIFESLGYVVEKLDRVVFAGLTKKDLPRGHWRTLTAQEIINLKNLSL